MINSFSAQELATDYWLDIFEEQVVGDLAYGVPTVPLPIDLKGRLFDHVGASEVDRLPYTDTNVNYPKPPLLNRPIETDVRGVP
jgi:hypothetical protein